MTEADDAWIIVYEDAEMPDEKFSGHGATEAATNRFDAMRVSWNCHLFKRVVDASGWKRPEPSPPFDAAAERAAFEEHYKFEEQSGAARPWPLCKNRARSAWLASAQRRRARGMKADLCHALDELDAKDVVIRQRDAEIATQRTTNEGMFA